MKRIPWIITVASLCAVSAVLAAERTARRFKVVPAGKTYVKLNANALEIGRFKSGQPMAITDCAPVACPPGWKKDVVCWNCKDRPEEPAPPPTKILDPKTETPPAPERPPPKGGVQTIDLRPAMKTMQFKEGSNVAHKGSGHRLVATVSAKKVVRWSAIDDNGNPLQTQVTVTGVQCVVCVATPNGQQVCYPIDCKDAPAPKKSEVKAQQ